MGKRVERRGACATRREIEREDRDRISRIWHPTWFAEGFHLLEDPDVACSQAHVAEPTIARMLGGNAAEQFGVQLVQKVGG